MKSARLGPCCPARVEKKKMPNAKTEQNMRNIERSGLFTFFCHQEVESAQFHLDPTKKLYSKSQNMGTLK
jgi:hypothetical protein